MEITMNKNKDLCIDTIFEEFIKSNKIKNLSEKTITIRRDSFKNLVKFLRTREEYKIELPDINEINKHLVYDYILYMKEDLGLKIVTLNTYLRHNKAFLYWCMKEGYCRDFSISLLKESEKMRETYTEEELKRLLKKPNIKKCRFTEYRNWVIVNFLFGTGVRRGTLINIKIEDIDFENGLFTVKVSKSGAVSILPLPDTLIATLSEYLGYRGGEKGDYLFCTERGEKINENGLYNAIKRYNIKRGVENTSLHSFRHTFAKGIVVNHGDIFRLQKLLLHSDLKMTKRYVDLFSTDLQEGYSEYNPLDTFMKDNNKSAIKMKR